MTNFCYFGKAPCDGDYIGNVICSPKNLVAFLDEWAIQLSKEQANVGDKAVLFSMPEKNYRSFLVGVAWSSTDSGQRRYPFALYRRLFTRHFWPFLPIIQFSLFDLAFTHVEIWKKLYSFQPKQWKFSLSRQETFAIVGEDSIFSTKEAGFAEQRCFKTGNLWMLSPRRCWEDMIRAIYFKYYSKANLYIGIDSYSDFRTLLPYLAISFQPLQLRSCSNISSISTSEKLSIYEK